MVRRLLMIMLGKAPSDDERHRKAQEIERLTVKSDATVLRADRAIAAQQALTAELDGAVASFRRRR